jgi:hypothetical protein
MSAEKVNRAYCSIRRTAENPDASWYEEKPNDSTVRVRISGQPDQSHVQNTIEKV